jgi:acetyl esterase/lipase
VSEARVQYYACVQLTRVFLCTAFTLASFAQTTQHVTLPLWPQGTPEPWHVEGQERDVTKPTEGTPGGRRVTRISDVSQPSLTVYSPKDATGVTPAVLVFPGGGYRILAYDLEGTEVCDWLNSLSMICVLVKYRVPVQAHYPESSLDLEDAQQAMRLTRAHAGEWHVDPQRVGVLGFSAGAHLAAVLSNHADFKGPGVPESNVDAHPNFALIIYPGYLRDEAHPGQVAQGVQPTANTPPTFLVQAENDPVHEENALFYFQALKEAKVPAELHLFAEGGHGYGLRPTELPVTHWPEYAATWFHTIHVLGGTTSAIKTP